MAEPERVAPVAVPDRKHWHSNTHASPTTARTGAWREGLEPWEAALCEAVLGRRMRALGYEPSGLPRPRAEHLGSLRAGPAPCERPRRRARRSGTAGSDAASTTRSSPSSRTGSARRPASSSLKRMARRSRAQRGPPPRPGGLRGGRAGRRCAATTVLQLGRPIEPDLAVFAAYWYRGYSCNPRAIYEKLREQAPWVRGVWVVKPGARRRRARRASRSSSPAPATTTG